MANPNPNARDWTLVVPVWRKGEFDGSILLDCNDAHVVAGRRLWRGPKSYAMLGRTTLQRAVLGLRSGDGLHGDHINRNRSDYRRANLRAVTPQVNAINRSARIGSQTGVRNVFRRSDGRGYFVSVCLNGRYHRAYGFKTVAEAVPVAAEMRARIYGNAEGVTL